MRQYTVAVLGAAVWAGCLGQTADESTQHGVGIDWDDPTSGPTGRWPGQTAFESAGPWSYIWGPWLRALSSAETPDTAATAQRIIEESDVFKIDGDTLFVLNPYRGLVAIDVRRADRPAILGRAPLFGQPKEMYVRDGRAFVLLDDWISWRDDSTFHGSNVAVVDTSDPANLEVLGQHEVAGSIADSRLVGDVLYVVSSTNEWTGTESRAQTHVLSLDLGNPASIREVDRESFDGSGNLIHVTEDFVFVAAPDWQSGMTRVTAVNIMDPRGQMFVGGSAHVDGMVEDRFMLDFAGDDLRVVSHDWQDGGHAFVTTLVADRSARTLKQDGVLDLRGIGQLTAARFSADRAYLVHQVRVDPLDVIDLSNPSSPVRLSSLEIPGWLEHVEVRGDRLLGIGFDAAGSVVPARECPGYDYVPLASGRQLSAAIFDVSDPEDTCEAARVRFGEGSWAWTNAFYDDKALRLLDDEKLLLVPFDSWVQPADGTGRAIDAVQLIDADLPAMRLAVRGRVESLAQVDRSFLDRDRLFALGQRELLVSDVADRDHPRVTAALELTRNVSAFSPIGTRGYGVQLVGDGEADAELRVVRLSSPDAEKGAAVSRIALGAAPGELYVNGSTATVVSRRWDETGARVRLANYNVSSRGAITFKGQIELAGGYGGGIGLVRFYSGVTDVLRARNDLFVVSAPSDAGLKFSIVSIADPAHPRVVQEHTRPNDDSIVYDLKAWWNDVFVVAYTPAADGPEIDGDFGIQPAGDETVLTRTIMPPWRPRAQRVRYSVTRISFSSNGTPRVGTPINVPGRLVDVSRNGRIWTLLDSRWNGGSTQDKAIFTVRVNHDASTASLLDGVSVEEGVEDVKVRGNAAYYTAFDSWMGPIVPLEGIEDTDGDGTVIMPEPIEPALRLVVLDVTNPERISESSRTAIESDGSGGTLLDVRQVGHTRYAFLSLYSGAVAVYDVTAPAAPDLSLFQRAQGWFSTIVLSRDERAAYLPGGYYGVLELPLE